MGETNRGEKEENTKGERGPARKREKNTDTPQTGKSHKKGGKIRGLTRS